VEGAIQNPVFLPVRAGLLPAPVDAITPAAHQVEDAMIHQTLQIQAGLTRVHPLQRIIVRFVQVRQVPAEGLNLPAHPVQEVPAALNHRAVAVLPAGADKE